MADDKPYQSLYRKYRPQGPQDVLGQEHVIRALMGGVKEGRLAHAFLFCGPRGTGKTSTARILAKMVNCEQGPTAEPCGVCQQCELIREGGHLDVVEIDAASHGGVEDARELREKAPTAPVIGREKIYIIDEAQRLTAPAFDALLKVLEEPPEGVRFVFATTEPQKMPATIVGRCQRFDFRRVPMDELARHLERIAGKEDITLAPDAAEAIARHCEGSVRDALSLLDQASLLGGGSVGMGELDSLLGAPASEVQDELADALAVGDTRAVFEVVNRLVQSGQDLRHVTAETLGHFRNMLVTLAAPEDPALVDVTPEEHARLRAQSAKFTPHEISRIIGLLLAAQADMRWTTSPRITMELALVRASMPETDPTPQALVSRLERLERRSGIDAGATHASAAQSAPVVAPVVALPAAAAAAAVAVAAPTPSPAALTSRPKPKVKEAKPAPPVSQRAPDAAPAGDAAVAAPAPDAVAPVQPVAPNADGSVDIDMLRRSWPTLVTHLRTARQMILATNLESVTPASYDGETLELMFPSDRAFGVKKVEEREADLRAMLNEVFGIQPRVSCVTKDMPVDPFAPVDDDDGPASDGDAVILVMGEFGAQIATEEGS